MKIKKLHIENYKSLVNFEINEPNPFTVFVGPNGSGKSNIFEALQFLNFSYKYNYSEAVKVFGDQQNILNYSTVERYLTFELNYFNFPSKLDIRFFEDDTGDNSKKDLSFNLGSLTIATNFKKDSKEKSNREFIYDRSSGKYSYDNEIEQFQENFLRLFVNNYNIQKIKSLTDTSLASDASNLETVLKRVFENKNTRAEITEWLQLFVPDFEKIEIRTSDLSGNSEMAIYEKTLKKPLTKNLISDGTYNILALITAVFQYDEPQFLCIEEPENGLHPYVIRELVKFFRQQCEEKGHYIWLNTHSQTLVDELQPHEIILVDKKEGATQIKQFSKDKNLHGLKMDFAWLSNSLGGGVPW